MGNLFELLCKHPWKEYARWAKKYNSDIISLHIPGVTFVILNNEEVVQDLFVKRAPIYSDRPHVKLFDMLSLTPRIFPFQNHDERWRNARKAFTLHVARENSSHTRLHQLTASRRLVLRLLGTQDPPYDVRLAAGDYILSAMYGIPPHEQEEFVATANETVSLALELSFKGFLVTIFPFLMHLPSWCPGPGLAMKMDRLVKYLDAMIRVPFQAVQADMATRRLKSSVTSRYLSSLEDYANTPTEELNYMADVFGIAYSAGADTVGALSNSFVLAMLLYPEVQRKAHVALETVLRGRFPDFGDYEKIPYIDAIVQEVLRWNPVAPLGLLHASKEEDSYKDYVIPKGAICIANVWAMLHNEERYGPGADEFRPERFLNTDGALDLSRTNSDGAFGFGRRKCPGASIAKEYLWILFATILSAYDIVDGTDKDGQALDCSKIQYASALISVPPEFHCRFRLRPGVTKPVISEAIEGLN
ncbi:unnamed protein product [Cyclocybe aegerita]|uniref:Cytochrome P450 n=1 Tax=Cyclocybe aegerita TaxID=1973307 RepID=A0A8S0VQV2_CYCAE|nr:unnamed protein product [Cyclocybe aegerita]